MSKTAIFLNQSSLTDLFTIVFVFVDDYLIVLEREGVCQLPKLDKQKGSYSEIMTISLVGELLKQRYAGDWFEFVKTEYAQLFPILPDKTRFYRIQNNLERIYTRFTGHFADFALRFARSSVTELDSYVIDSKAVPIVLDKAAPSWAERTLPGLPASGPVRCKGVRWARPRAMSEASSGYSSIGMFYGFKLHAITDEQGLMCRFLLASAHVFYQQAACCLLAATDAFVLGDKNYHGCGIYAQPKENFRHPKPWSSAFAWVRKTIETVFSSLVRSRNLALVQLNSFRSVRAAVCRKIAAHNLAWFLLH